MHVFRQKSLQGWLFWLLDKPLAVYGLVLRIQTRQATLAPDLAVRVCLSSYHQNPNIGEPIPRRKGE